MPSGISPRLVPFIPQSGVGISQYIEISVLNLLINMKERRLVILDIRNTLEVIATPRSSLVSIGDICLLCRRGVEGLWRRNQKSILDHVKLGNGL